MEVVVIIRITTRRSFGKAAERSSFISGDRRQTDIHICLARGRAGALAWPRQPGRDRGMGGGGGGG